MVQIDFYHLQDETIIEILPSLLRRTLSDNKKGAIWFSHEETLKKTSQALWKSPYPNWLPHGDKHIACPNLQPIWLSTEKDRPNQAEFLFLIENSTCDTPNDFKRIFYLFDGNDDNARKLAREQWIKAKEIAQPLTYWKKENNKWVYRR